MFPTLNPQQQNPSSYQNPFAVSNSTAADPLSVFKLPPNVIKDVIQQALNLTLQQQAAKPAATAPAPGRPAPAPAPPPIQPPAPPPAPGPTPNPPPARVPQIPTTQRPPQERTTSGVTYPGGAPDPTNDPGTNPPDPNSIDPGDGGTNVTSIFRPGAPVDSGGGAGDVPLPSPGTVDNGPGFWGPPDQFGQQQWVSNPGAGSPGAPIDTGGLTMGDPGLGGVNLSPIDTGWNDWDWGAPGGPIEWSSPGATPGEEDPFMYGD